MVLPQSICHQTFQAPPTVTRNPGLEPGARRLYHPDQMTGSPEFSSWAEALKEPHPARRKPYRTYRQIWRQVMDLARRREGVVSVRAYGTSVRGEPLWCVSVNHPGATGPGVLLVDKHLRVGNAGTHPLSIRKIYCAHLSCSGLRRFPPTLMSLCQAGNQDLTR